MNKILVILALLITVSLASVVNANEQQYGNNVPLTYKDYVVYGRGSCYPGTGCWTEERVTVVNTDNVGGYFSVSYGNYCDACITESIYILAGGSYIFNIGIFANGNSPIQYRVNAPTKYIVVPTATQTVPTYTPATPVTYQIQDSQISNPDSWVPLRGESCWSSGTNAGKCTGKSIGRFLKGFLSGLWHANG